VTIDGYGMLNGFIDLLYTPLGTTSNYNAIANLYNSQITRAPAKPFSASCFFVGCSLATASNSGHSSASRAQVLLSQPSLQISTVSSTIAQSLLSLPCRAQVTGCPSSSLLITLRHGQSRQHPVAVAARTCLQNRCPVTDLI
jgi:hypothetical protein